MNCASVVAPSGASSSRIGRVTPTVGFFLLASITVSFLAGSSAPTPLYPLYQAQWGLSPTTITFVFAIYALALLCALLVTGRLSDHLGRRPILIVATVAQAATMLVFATANGLAALVFARIVQGLSTGAAVAAVGAGMLDLDRARGAVANAVAPPLGTAAGAISAGLLVHYLPAPTQLVYLLLGAIYILQGIGVGFMTETTPPRAGALASLKPQFNVPAAAREALMLAVPALVASWALAGFYASLGPALIGHIFELNASLIGGLALFVLAGSGAVSIVVLQRQDPHRMMFFGAVALLAGVAVATASLSYHSTSAFFVGTALSGMGFGAGFQGAVRTVVAFAAPRERAGVLSVIFVVSYLAMGIPAVIAGYFVAQHGDILGTARTYAAVVMILAAVAALGTRIRPSAASQALR